MSGFSHIPGAEVDRDLFGGLQVRAVVVSSPLEQAMLQMMVDALRFGEHGCQMHEFRFLGGTNEQRFAVIKTLLQRDLIQQNKGTWKATGLWTVVLREEQEPESVAALRNELEERFGVKVERHRLLGEHSDRWGDEV